MRHRHTTRPDNLRQPGWAPWIADVLRLTDSSGATGVALATCLLVASALRLAVSAVARKVAGAGRETVRKAIAASLPQDPRQLELRIAAGLRRAIPRQGGRRSVPVAIDFHQRPYYGQRARTPGVVGGKAERGARWFWSYATAVSLRRGRRYTLAITSVEASDTFTTVVERLLAQVSWSGVRVRYVLLDRAFYAVGVVNALRRRGLRFIIPMVRRGKAAKKFFRRGCRGWFDHTFESRRREEGKASVRVAVVPGPDGNRPLVFACSEGFNALPDVVLRYRRRFGIETSYRQLGECLAVTTSRDVVYRLLLVGVSLLIRAWWVVSRGVTLGAIRWDLIVEFTTTQQRTPATQTAPPQQHAPT